MSCRFGLPSQMFVVLIFWSVAHSLDILPVTRVGKPDQMVDMPSVSSDLLDEAFFTAQQVFQSRVQLENSLPPSGIIPPIPKSVEARHQRFLAFKQLTADLDLNASYLDTGSRFLQERLNLTSDQATFGLKGIDFPPMSNWTNTLNGCNQIFSIPSCDSNLKFRSVDGSCNNLEHPNWGRSHSCMERFLPPVYNDGVSEPRKSKSGNDLPNARNISLHVHEALNPPNGSFTTMMTGFGQFVTHDITMGLMTRTVVSQSMIHCCPLGENKHPECSMSIEIPQNNDDFYSQNNQTCMNFVRSALCNTNCGLGPRQHSTQITAYIDASNTYGSDDEDTSYLRLYKNGLLNSQSKSGKYSGEYLPVNDDPNYDQCSIPEQDQLCFSGGDKRVNEQPGLSAIHNLFLRQHNRLARLYKKKYPSYNDDQLYNLTRRVVTAQYQNVVYKEFLPVLMGPKYMDYFMLTTGHGSTYDPKTQGALLNEFMTAAQRFGHTMIQNTFSRGPDTTSSFNLDENYFTAFILMEGEFDPVLKGLASQPGNQFDSLLVTAATHTLYRQAQMPFGMDLAALNIQRGRDQGTAAYTKYIEYCFNINITSFEDLDRFMNSTNRMKLQMVYENVEDIDLFTGGVSEDRLTGAAVGPTFACILGAQYYRLKFGDRFFFEHQNQAGSFTRAQLTEIRKVTLAEIMCSNSNAIAKIAPNVFLIGSPSNQLTDCKNIPGFDYSIF